MAVLKQASFHPDLTGRVGLRVAPTASLTLFAAALVLTACGGTNAPAAVVPSEGDAMAYLQRVLAVVDSGDLTHLCDLGSGVCETTLRDSDPATVPTSHPTVVGTRVIEPWWGNGGAWSPGGRVLELCGRDGLDQPYYSEMLVFRDGDRLISTVPTFWLGITIAASPGGSATTSDSPARPVCPKS